MNLFALDTGISIQIFYILGWLKQQETLAKYTLQSIRMLWIFNSTNKTKNYLKTHFVNHGLSHKLLALIPPEFTPQLPINNNQHKLTIILINLDRVNKALPFYNTKLKTWTIPNIKIPTIEQLMLFSYFYRKFYFSTSSSSVLGIHKHTELFYSFCYYTIQLAHFIVFSVLLPNTTTTINTNNSSRCSRTDRYSLWHLTSIGSTQLLINSLCVFILFLLL